MTICVQYLFSPDYDTASIIVLAGLETDLPVIDTLCTLSLHLV
jgi:hypothetical protein